MGTEVNYCKCGCKQTIPFLDKRGRPLAYIRYHRIPSRKGAKLTEEQKKRMCGRIGWNKGEKLSEITKIKISETNKIRGIKPPLRTGISPWNKGLKGFRAGILSHLWKGGFLPLKILIRSSFEYRQWRTNVFIRDNRTCQWCNQYRGNLNADHIKPFSQILEENKIDSLEKALACAELWDIKNGRTLCKDCHKTTDSYFNRYYQKQVYV